MQAESDILLILFDKGVRGCTPVTRLPTPKDSRSTGFLVPAMPG